MKHNTGTDRHWRWGLAGVFGIISVGLATGIAGATSVAVPTPVPTPVPTVVGTIPLGPLRPYITPVPVAALIPVVVVMPTPVPTSMMNSTNLVVGAMLPYSQPTPGPGAAPTAQPTPHVVVYPANPAVPSPGASVQSQNWWESQPQLLELNAADIGTGPNGKK